MTNHKPLVTSNQLLITGKKYEDQRGIITFNNDFDASQIKRIYTIENNSLDFIRGWQGHKIEQRWFACVQGSFEIDVIVVNNFDEPSRSLIPTKYTLDSEKLDFLHVKPGCITAIKAKEINSKLLVLSDYAIGEIRDEYRFDLNYFKSQQ